MAIVLYVPPLPQTHSGRMISMVKIIVLVLYLDGPSRRHWVGHGELLAGSWSARFCREHGILEKNIYFRFIHNTSTLWACIGIISLNFSVLRKLLRHGSEYTNSIVPRAFSQE